MKRLETRVRELERGIVNSEDIPIEVVVLDGTEEENEKKIKEAKQRIEQEEKKTGAKGRLIMIKLVRGMEDYKKEID